MIARDYLHLCRVAARGEPLADARPDPMRDAYMLADSAMYRLMVENTVDVIIRYDASSRRQYISPAAREIFGYEPAEMMAMAARDMIHPDDLKRGEAAFRSIGPQHPSLQSVFRARRRDGLWIWVEARYRFVPEDDGVIAVIRDITARKRAEDLLAETNAKLERANRELQALAQQDGLTGLGNRRYFDTVLADEFFRARRQELPLGLVLLDVDYFKGFNDRYGHLAGDECLRRVSQAVLGVLRRPGDHAARYGGEEIAVLLPATERAGAAAMAERMRAAVAGLAIEHLGSVFGFVTISAGVSVQVPFAEAAQPVDMIGAADEALYRAKRDGRNLVREWVCVSEIVPT